MYNKRHLKRWFLIAVAILLMTSSVSSVYASGSGPEPEERGTSADTLEDNLVGLDTDSEEAPSQEFRFHELFQVDISPDISEGVDVGEDVVVTVSGRELTPGSRVGIDGEGDEDRTDLPVPAKINVTNVLWDGTPWYAEYDDTIWRRNDTDEKYYRRVSDHEVKLAIYGDFEGDERYQFPAGCVVSFNLYIENRTRGKFESQEYTYEVGGAFPNKPADYDDPENPDDDLFEENINVNWEPDNPNVQDDVEINITSKYEDVKIDRASVHIQARYPDPDREIEYYQYFFNPANKNETWPSLSATVTIPADEWHDIPDTEIIFHLDARDPHGHQVVSENYSYEVQDVGTWRYPDDFEPNIRLSTEPDITRIDEVGRTTTVEVTIESRFETVPIENAYLYYHITNTWHGVPHQGQWRMEQESSTEWSYEIPAQNPEVNVEFFVRAWDITESMIESREYSYTIEEEPDDEEEGPAPPGQTLFYVSVHDAEREQYVSDVMVSIGNHTWETTTYTDMSGMCYPNATGERHTPEYLSLDEPYWIEVYYPHQTNNETEEMVRIEYVPTEDENETEILYDEGNLVVTRVNNTLEFEYNSPPEPPDFADIYRGHNRSTTYSLIFIFTVLVMAAPVGWKLYKLMEEGKQERSLVK